MSTEVTEARVATPVPNLPELAKMPAVNKLAHALALRGMRDNAAEAIAVAVCDPSEARRQLEQPAVMRVSGGTLDVIYTDVWVPAVLPFPENPRMLPGLTYAIESRAGRRRPLPPARPSADGSTELVMEPVTSVEIVEHLDAQIRYLRDNNDLSSSVGEHGIHEPLLLVPLAFVDLDLQDGSRTGGADLPEDHRTILTSVDGNSRLAAAYRHLRLDPAEVVGKLLGNPRATRQRIGNTLALQRTDGDASPEAQEALRSASAPAAIIVGFTPAAEDRDLLDAIQSRLGAIHVAPPKQWSSASKFDLLLNVALDALQRSFDGYAASIEVDGGMYREWLAGNLTAHEAEALGLDPEVDFRAAALRWWFRGRRAAVSAAIRHLDITGNVTAAMRANIAAEGALRAFRSEMSATEADNARRVLATLYQLEDLDGEWSTEDDEGLGSVTTATRAAASEVAATGRPGEAARLLMVVAFYWLARYRVVPLQTRGGQADRRKIVDVLTMMCRSEHGIRVLGQAVKDGRQGIHPRAVGPDGKVERRDDGTDVLLTDEWIRRTWSKGRKADGATSPLRELESQSDRLLEVVRDVKGALEGLRDPLSGDGLPLVETLGLRLELANQIISELDKIRDDVIELRLIGKRNSVAGPTV